MATYKWKSFNKKSTESDREERERDGPTDRQTDRGGFKAGGRDRERLPW